MKSLRLINSSGRQLFKSRDTIRPLSTSLMTTSSSLSIPLLSRDQLNNLGFLSSGGSSQIALPKSVKLPYMVIPNRGFRSSAGVQEVMPFLLADIGEGIKECEIKQWFVKEGDTINEFDPVCQVESDKASVDITSRFAGKVKKLYFKVGEMASVGKPLIDIEVADAAGQTTKAAEPAKAAEQKQTSQIQNKTDSHENNGEYKTFATPAVRRIAKENNINLEDVQGTGKDGRITKEDVLNFVQNGKKPAVSGKPSAAAPSPIPMKSSTPPSSAPSVPSRTFQTSGSKGERREQVKGFKKAMVKTMNEAWRTIPHFGYCDEITMNDLIQLRNELKDHAKEQHGDVKLTFMPFFIKAASLALHQNPILNSSLSSDETELIYKEYHNIGVAMDTPNGLIVPNIKNVEDKSIIDIAKELNRLQGLASKGQLGSNDLADGTFTISNIGTIGGTYTSPIIVSPQVCIGAVGKVSAIPRFDKKGNVYPASIMNVSWSADHRVIDGATMARFGNAWKHYLENPKNFILSLK